MFIGIDLGTSNSSLAVFDGDSVVMVPSSLGENLTPSVVRMDARGTIVTGRKAHRFLESDPANTWAEFKRLMGTGERLPFAAAGQELLPEELSAKVLELPQNHATMRAGKLAGLSEVALIQNKSLPHRSGAGYPRTSLTGEER
jgi:molecular chaperone DnaK